MDNKPQNAVIVTELERLRQGLQVLQEISFQLTKSQDLHAILQRVVDLIVDFLHVKKASIMLIDSDHFLRINAFYGMPIEIARDTRTRVGEQISGRVAQSGQPIMSQDLVADRLIDRDPRVRYETNSFICMPLKVQDRVFGVLNLNDKIEEGRFDVYDLELVRVVAGQTATVIANYHWYTQLTRSLAKTHSSNQRLLAVQKRLRVVIESILDGVVATDASGRIILFNRSAGLLFPQMKTGYSIFSRIESQAFGKWLRGRYSVVREQGAGGSDYIVDLTKAKHTHLSVHTVPVVIHKNRPKYFINIFTDVTFRLTLEEKKREFISLISHELRTPITAIKTYSAAMLKGQLGPINPDVQEGIAIISEAAARLHREVNNLMIMSKLDQDDFSIEKVPFDLRAEIRSQCELLANAAQPNGIAIKLVIPDELPIAFGDPGMIRIAFSNIVHNAIKYSPPNSNIEVVCELKENDGKKAITVSVEDRGPGISPRDIKRIFDRFEQIESHLTRHYGGIGLGLSMSQKIINLHGSEIKVTSIPRVGSTFSFEISVHTGEA